MISVRVASSDSWLDPDAARKLSGQLADRLWKRCQGHRGLFLTLTYRHDDYKDALDLYRRQSEDQHVPMFFRRLQRMLGDTFKGRWFCKLEFQRGGWCHWHIIILDVQRIEHDVLAATWGHGFVWVRRLSEKSVRYCCKYTTKPGAVPAWLMLERPRSVKIVRVSPGFWRNPPREPSDPEVSDDPDPPFRIEGIYRPVGLRIADSRKTLICRDADQANYRRVDCDLAALLVTLMERGYGVVGVDRGWLVVDAPSVAAFDRAVAAVGGLQGGGGAAPAAPPPLHLIGTGNPDRFPPLIEAWYRDEAQEVVA